MAHIRIISPSGAIDTSYIEGAQRRLLSWGHSVSIAPHATGRWGRFAATDAERLSDLVSALTDPTVDFILCARGGYGLQRIVGSIDEALPEDYDYGHMPTIIGFSDITVLHAWVQSHGGRSLHAPMCKHLATMDEQSLPMQMMRDALDGKPLHYDFAFPTPVIGGNLSVLYGLQGTPYGIAQSSSSSRSSSSSNSLRSLSSLSSLRGCTLLIEDIGERHYHIERMLLGLKMSGVFDGLSGLIIGQFTDCPDDPGMGETVQETILRVVGRQDYPILTDAPFGHVDNNLPIWLGSEQ